MSDDDAREPFDWFDFLELAKELAERDDEASQRTAVSRSYYAVFHLAQRVLETLDPGSSTHRARDSHQQVWERFRALPQRQAKSAERKACSLLKERRQADYERGDSERWSKRATDAVARAQAAVHGLADLLPDR